MAKKLTEEEMRKDVLKDSEIKKVWGTLNDIVPEAVAEYEEKRRQKSSADC